MRSYGSINPLADTPIPADTFGAIIISTAGAVVANDWPTGARRVAFSGEMNFYVNWATTKAHAPTTASSGSTGSSEWNELNPGVRNISTSISTGYSVTARTSGVVTAQFWGV